jgi:hypothetical protein
MRLSLAGGSPVTLASQQYTPAGIAIDSQSVYWSVSSTYVAPSDGGAYSSNNTGAIMKLTPK